MGFDQKAQLIRIVLDELSHLADWEDKGEPDFRAELTASDLEFWKMAAARGLDVPPGIAALLGLS